MTDQWFKPGLPWNRSLGYQVDDIAYAQRGPLSHRIAAQQFVERAKELIDRLKSFTSAPCNCSPIHGS